MQFKEVFQQLPLIAILRGVTPERILSVAKILVEAGFRIIEVPMNSPQPLESIQLLAKEYENKVIVGAGTVTQNNQIGKIKSHGGKLIFMPHLDVELISIAQQENMITIPGVATPSEAFCAIKENVDALKLFPAEVIQPKVVKSLKAVLPKTMPLIPVGSVNPDQMSAYVTAGADGFGLGSVLYQPKYGPIELEKRAKAMVHAYESVRSEY